jgi:hypothetical protein
MRKLWRRGPLAGVLASVLMTSWALPGCTRSGSQVAAEVVADTQLQQILQHVPADTPYAFIGMGSAGTRAFMDKIYGSMLPLLALLEGKRGELERAVPEEHRKLVSAILNEFSGKLSVDGMAALGLDVEARFAFYGIGLLPAMRVQLRDPAALKAALDRVQQNAGVSFPTRKLGEIEYWPIDGKKMSGAVAIVGDQLVVGVAPTALADRVFALLLGNEKPTAHLGKSERFQQMLADHNLGTISAGFVDSRTIAEAFLGEGDPLGKDILAALAPELAARWPQLGDVCKQEIRQLVALAPRMVFGTDQIDAQGFAGRFVLELRPDLAQELMAMRTPVGGLDPANIGQPIFAMGAALDMNRALSFAQTTAAGIQATPYACPQLAELNRAASEFSHELKSTPPELWTARGFALVLDDLKLAGFLPSDVRGYLSVGFTDTKKLISNLQALPPFTNITLTDDGVPHTLPNGTIPFLSDVAHGLQAGKGGVIALGKDAESRVKAILNEPASSDPPLMLVAYDMGRFGDLIGQVSSAAGSMPEELKLVMDIYKSMGLITYDARANERGLVMTTGVKLR